MFETGFYTDGQDEWPHILEKRVSRWHLPQLAIIEDAPVDEANVSTIEYTAMHDGKVLLDAMSVTFD